MDCIDHENLVKFLLKQPSVHLIEYINIILKIISQNTDFTNLPGNKETSDGRSFSSMLAVNMLWELGRISTWMSFKKHILINETQRNPWIWKKKLTAHKNSKSGEKMRTLWFLESATITRPSSSQQIPDGRQNSCRAVINNWFLKWFLSKIKHF